MTLRFSFYLQQLLSAIAGFLFLLGGGAAAQQPAAPGQDIIVLADGKQQIVGKVVGASAVGVQMMRDANSSMTIPMAQVKQVIMAVIPPELAAAQKAVEQKQYDNALIILKSLEKFKGLPADFAQQAAAMVGDIYIEKGDVVKADNAFAEFQRLYPNASQADIGLAKVAVAKKDFATAKAKLEPVIAKAEAAKTFTKSEGFGYSIAYLLMGQIKENAGELQPALESYLKTVTIYYYDRNSATAAQEKADALRKNNPTLFIP